MDKIKIKDLPKSTNLGGVKVKTPNGFIGYWVSQWQKGVWLSKNPDCKGQIFPQFVDDLKEVLEWEVMESVPTQSGN